MERNLKIIYTVTKLIKCFKKFIQVFNKIKRRKEKRTKYVKRDFYTCISSEKTKIQNIFFTIIFLEFSEYSINFSSYCILNVKKAVVGNMHLCLIILEIRIHTTIQVLLFNFANVKIDQNEFLFTAHRVILECIFFHFRVNYIQV